MENQGGFLKISRAYLFVRRFSYFLLSVIILITIFCPDRRSQKQIIGTLDKLKIEYSQFKTIILVNSSTAYGVCESCDKQALRYFKNKKVPVVTCGMGTKDTLTLSSFNQGTAMITVQRELPFEYEKSEKPEEFTLHFKGNPTPFSVMAIFIVLLCCLRTNTNQFINFLN